MPQTIIIGDDWVIAPEWLDNPMTRIMEYDPFHAEHPPIQEHFPLCHLLKSEDDPDYYDQAPPDLSGVRKKPRRQWEPVRHWSECCDVCYAYASNLAEWNEEQARKARFSSPEGVERRRLRAEQYYTEHPFDVPTEAATEGNRGRLCGTYVDVGAALSGSLEAPSATLGKRTDGASLFYEGAANGVIGDSGVGKTWVVAAVCADILASGGSVLWVDIDHNGVAATLARFATLGVPAEVLGDRERFALAMPEISTEFDALVLDAKTWRPTAVVVDSLGEMLALYGANAKNDEDFAPLNQRTIAAMAAAGPAVVYLDHTNKGEYRAGSGGTGTLRKKAALDGVLLHALPVSGHELVKGQGGKVDLAIVKDRHGSVSESGDRDAKRNGEQLAGTFELVPLGYGLHTWKIHPPKAPLAESSGADVETLLTLDPEPRSITDVRNRMGWGATRATRAYNEWRVAA